MERLNSVYSRACGYLAGTRSSYPPPDVELRIACLSYDVLASGYLRIVLPMLELRKAGLAQVILREEIDSWNLSDGQKKQAAVNALNLSNMILLPRAFYPEVLPSIREYQMRGGSVVLEIDDYVQASVQTKTTRLAEFWNNEKISGLEKMAERLDAAITSTDGLAKEYSRFCPAYCIPNALDVANQRWNFPHEKYPEHKDIVIGYLGGWTHGYDLSLLTGPLKNIMQNHDNVRFRIIGIQPKWLRELPQDRLLRSPFSWLSEYPKYMSDVDIGVIPLRDNEFNERGKSSLKFLEYTMAGAATVASPVGQTKKEVAGRGYLAETEDDWVRILSHLIENPAKIKKAQDRSLRYLLSERTIQAMLPQWYQALREIRKRRLSKANIYLPVNVNLGRVN